MKLLSSKEQTSKTDRELTLKKLRTAEITEEFERKRGSLNEINDEFENALKKQRVLFVKEKEEQLQQILSLKKEVQELEKRRFLALLPLDEEKKKIENEREQLIAEKEVLNSEKSYFEVSVENFKDQLDKVSEREVSISKREMVIDAREQGVRLQSESIKKQSEELSLRMERFIQESNVQTRIFTSKEVEVTAKQEIVTIAENRLKTWEKDLVDRERALKDKYQTLERTIKRINGR